MGRRGFGVTVICAAVAMVALAEPEAYVRHIVEDRIEGSYITNVPDDSQPPPNPLGFRSVDNWCAPLAAANAIVFLDQVAEAEWAIKVSGGFSPDALSAYLGYFLATNGEGSPDRDNASLRRPGTLNSDIPAGVAGFVRWSGGRPPVPMSKESYAWHVDLREADAGLETLWEAYCEVIEKGIPAVLCFAFWNPTNPTALKLLLSSGDVATVSVYLWGEPLPSTELLRKEDGKIPEEEWDEKRGIGHAVTGVGFLKGDPDGDGPLPEGLWAIVHDNWSTTAEDVVIPWDHLTALVRFLPE